MRRPNCADDGWSQLEICWAYNNYTPPAPRKIVSEDDAFAIAYANSPRPDMEDFCTGFAITVFIYLMLGKGPILSNSVMTRIVNPLRSKFQKLYDIAIAGFPTQRKQFRDFLTNAFELRKAMLRSSGKVLGATSGKITLVLWDTKLPILILVFLHMFPLVSWLLCCITTSTSNFTWLAFGILFIRFSQHFKMLEPCGPTCPYIPKPIEPVIIDAPVNVPTERDLFDLEKWKAHINKLEYKLDIRTCKTCKCLKPLKEPGYCNEEEGHEWLQINPLNKEVRNLNAKIEEQAVEIEELNALLNRGIRPWIRLTRKCEGERDEMKAQCDADVVRLLGEVTRYKAEAFEAKCHCDEEKAALQSKHRTEILNIKLDHEFQIVAVRCESTKELADLQEQCNAQIDDIRAELDEVKTNWASKSESWEIERELLERKCKNLSDIADEEYNMVHNRFQNENKDLQREVDDLRRGLGRIIEANEVKGAFKELKAQMA